MGAGLLYHSWTRVLVCISTTCWCRLYYALIPLYIIQCIQCIIQCIMKYMGILVQVLRCSGALMNCALMYMMVLQRLSAEGKSDENKKQVKKWDYGHSNVLHTHIATYSHSFNNHSNLSTASQEEGNQKLKKFHCHILVCEQMSFFLSVFRWPHFCLWTNDHTFVCKQMTCFCLWTDD